VFTNTQQMIPPQWVQTTLRVVLALDLITSRTLIKWTVWLSMILIQVAFMVTRVWISLNKSFIKIKTWQVEGTYCTQSMNLLLIRTLSQKKIRECRMIWLRMSSILDFRSNTRIWSKIDHLLRRSSMTY
jgi:hypothetical protein